MGLTSIVLQIYVPINPRKHWIVMLVGVDDEVVEIWDSYLYGAKSTGEDLVYDVVSTLTGGCLLILFYFFRFRFSNIAVIYFIAK